MWYSGCHFHFVQGPLNMYPMSGLARSRALIVSILPIVLCSCYRPSPNVPAEGLRQASQTPFEAEPAGNVNALRSTSAEESADSRGLPFQNSQTLPPGSLLTVTLRAPIVASTVAKDSFEAVIDSPVILAGNRVIPQGTRASGRMEFSHVSKLRPDRAYVRLALNSVCIDGTWVPIQTANLFVRQLPQNTPGAGAMGVENGRRLTFRLTEPLFFAAQRAPATK
ncbi:MAG TPA: hypothetical protein VMU05_15900 [Dongiaceae bacterium]|nr:hypothetical protein [Dongiaceae bacterium]